MENNSDLICVDDKVDEEEIIKELAKELREEICGVIDMEE